MTILYFILLFILGACFGSFLCCQARRLHLKSTKSTKKLSKRSVCLHCGYQLKWYDNLPIISWLILKGKCRKCHRKIGIAELLAELGMAIALLITGFTIDINTASILGWAIFFATILLILVLGFLAIYDGLYGELPTSCLVLAIICAAIVLALKEWQILLVAPFSPDLVIKPVFSVLILGGLYLVLYLISKGQWVGDGDWLLGTAIGLAVFEPMRALVALFLANLIACIVMAPLVKKNRRLRIHLGPFLVIGFIICGIINLW